MAEKEFHIGSYRRFTKLRPLPDTEIDIAVSVKHYAPQISAKEYVRNLANQLCEQHQGISTYEGIFGGMPHIAGVRLTVPHVLAQVRNLGSVDAIVEYYDHTISKEQVEEAIKYAQRFLEVACAPPETNG
jgi:uncharacterized protein (DUF433 family)